VEAFAEAAERFGVHVDDGNTVTAPIQLVREQ
jgi:hypothetical protein